MLVNTGLDLKESVFITNKRLFNWNNGDIIAFSGICRVANKGPQELVTQERPFRLVLMLIFHSAIVMVVTIIKSQVLICW